MQHIFHVACLYVRLRVFDAVEWINWQRKHNLSSLFAAIDPGDHRSWGILKKYFGYKNNIVSLRSGWQLAVPILVVDYDVVAG